MKRAQEKLYHLYFVRVKASEAKEEKIFNTETTPIEAQGKERRGTEFAAKSRILGRQCGARVLPKSRKNISLP